MWEQTVEPKIIETLGQDRRHIQHRCVRCFGVGESDLEQMLPDLVRRGRSPRVGITVSHATITLRVSAEAASSADCETQMAPTIQTIHDCLGDLVFGSQDEELQHAVVRLLNTQQHTIATVEWGPGGMLADWLSGADPAGTVFHGGWIVRGEGALQTALGLPATQDEIAIPQLVADVARQARASLSTDFALAVGPFPSPNAVSDRFHFALATPERVIEEAGRFAGHPDILKSRATKQALNLLRLHLESLG
jgi:nicotinamide-nucleotide amidase